MLAALADTAPPPPPDAVALARGDLLARASVEVSARDAGVARALADYLPRGATVHVTFLPNVEYRETVATSRALAREGFNPVPHIAARSLPDRAALADYLARLSHEAEVRRVLLIGGDLGAPRGPFADCLSVLQTDELQKNGIQSVAFAGHPEGHAAVSDEVMTAALLNKIAFARKSGIAPSVITQMCFEAAPILDWTLRMRGLGMGAPVFVGAAAPTNAVMMLKFAIRCGVGPSVRALNTQAGRMVNLLKDAGPELLIDDLAQAIADDEGRKLGPIAGMHFFVFGGVKKAAAWFAALRTQTASGAA